MSRIIFTAGVFDLFHVGHVEILEESKKLGDLLAVGVITDEGVFSYKGKYPQYSFSERFEIVRAISFVDMVLAQAGTDPSDTIRELMAARMKPSVMTHGDDWDRLLQGNETLEQLGIEFVTIPRTRGRSTSAIVSSIRGAGNS